MVTIDQITEKVKARFWAKVEKSDGCWLWTAKCTAGKGRWLYGEFRIGKSTVMAHRASWMINRGEIPRGLKVCHTCDNTQCVRPDHLFLGTQKANIEDAVSKGRMASGERNAMALYPELRAKCGAYGERNGTHTHPEKRIRGEQFPQAKLTEYSVQVIRESHAAGLGGYKRLGIEFGVSWETIRNVVKRKTWAHVA